MGVGGGAVGAPMYTIRDFRAEDRAVWDHLYAACLANPDWAEVHIDGKSDPDLSVPHVDLVADGGTELLGWITGDVLRGPDSAGVVRPLRPWQGYVFAIAVHPARRGQGVGRGLLQAALDRYRSQGCVRVELAAATPVAARFYLACGGRQMTDQNHPHDGLVGSYEWWLGSTSSAI